MTREPKSSSDRRFLGSRRRNIMLGSDLFLKWFGIERAGIERTLVLYGIIARQKRKKTCML